MRIAYISLHWPRTKSSGIGRKIEEQLSYWRQAGHTVQFFSHQSQVSDPDDLIPGERFEFKTPGGLSGKLLTEINRCRAVLPLIKAVRDFSPDIIYLRWSMYVYPSYQLFSIAPVVVEINTNDVLQHEMLGKVLSTYNKLTRPIYLKHATGFVFVSNELLECKNFTGYPHPGIVIPNGIDLSKIQPVEAPRNARPRLGFIGTPNMTWHGVDKLIRLAILCPELDIDVIGMDNLDDGVVKPTNLFFHGYLDKDRSREVLSRDDVGLGTLALHRKAMNEASSLKTREYLAYGIPTILPYQDSDLDDLTIDTIQKIPNSEDNIEQNWKEIRDFAIKMQGKRVNRDLIARLIGSDHKEIARLKFFQECITGTTIKQ
jgi:glycosyltransferase involved in cell wall biosynthesis